MIQEFFEMILITKMFHWQTKRYGIHKETDQYFNELLEKMDHLIEVYQGIYGKIHLKNSIDIIIKNQTLSTFLKKLHSFNQFLIDSKETNQGFIQIRDEIISLNENLKYLLTFQ